MNWIYGVIFLISVIAAQQTQPQPQETPIQLFFKEKCYKHSKKGDSYDELMGLAFDFYKYAEYTATFIPEYVPHFCKEERTILTNKMNDITNIIKDCLPKEESFLPSFIKEVFDQFLHFLCHDGGTYTKTFFSSQGKDCRTQLRFNNMTGEIQNCFDLNVHFAVSDKGFLKKKDVCEDVAAARRCFSALLSKTCPDFKAFNELHAKFFSYISKPCSACTSTISNLVLLFTVSFALIHNKFL